MLELPRDITDPLGLHVQLAVLLASEAGRWRSSVSLEYAGRAVDAKQVLEVMMLGVRTGEHVVLHVDGPDERAAAVALGRLLEEF